MSDIEARSIGASAYRRRCPPRSDDKTPLFGIPRIGSFPFRGLARSSTGTAATRLRRTDGEPAATAPASTRTVPRKTPSARQQKADFLINGVVNNVCGGQPCHTFNFG